MVKVIFQDDYLLVLDKPPGLVVTSSETIPFDYAQGRQQKTLEDILKTDFGIKIDRGGIVHRLDKDTSGLLVVAKTTEILEKLQVQFKERTVKKQYLTLVHGLVEKPGKIEIAIGRNPGNREKFVADNNLVNSREAVTEYEPVKRLELSKKRIVEIFSGFSKIQFRKLHATRYTLFTLLKCFPHTGRTHQIRVHLKYIGNSVVGDEKYGGRRTARLDKRWCPRQFLHAEKLEFSHPIIGERMSFESKLPEDLEKALEVIEKGEFLK